MDKLFAKETGFLMHGKMSRKWQENKRSFVLSEEIESFQSEHGEKHVAAFVNRLSQQMAEIAEKQEQRG